MPVGQLNHFDNPIDAGWLDLWMADIAHRTHEQQLELSGMERGSFIRALMKRSWPDHL